MTTVEAAIIGTLVLVTMLGALEVGRAFFVYNMLEEVTRRGARMAAVCLISDATNIREVAILNTSGGGAGSPVVPRLDTSHIAIEYLRQNGTVIPSPATNFDQIEFVRVRIQNFTHELIIPGFTGLFNTPDFATTLPRESLGYTRDDDSDC